MSIKENYLQLQRELPGVRIIAVSKYVDAEKIKEAFDAGIRDFGENKSQDAEKKRALLPEAINKKITWHFLGHIQTNKAKKITGNYEYIHSIDSLKLVKFISELAKSKGIRQKILIQVNISEEETKYGFNSKQLDMDFQKILKMESLEIAGLMTMAPYINDEKVLREIFNGLRKLKKQLEKENKIKIPELSMGMSNDYKIAFEEGSTMVRIGQAIFKNEN